MDHSLPSPSPKVCYSVEQSLYSPGGMSENCFLKSPPDYYNPESVGSVQYDIASVGSAIGNGSLQPEDTLNFEAECPSASTPGPSIPSFTELLNNDEDDVFNSAQQVSQDEPVFATLNTTHIPLSGEFYNVINTRDVANANTNISVHTFPCSSTVEDYENPLKDLTPSQTKVLEDAIQVIEKTEGFSFTGLTDTTNTMAPIRDDIKHELQTKIKRKRRSAGLPEYVEEESSMTNEGMTDADKLRKERRKASNRRAAAKCRQKKLQEQAHLVQVKETAEAKIAELERENRRLRELLSCCSCPGTKQALNGIISGIPKLLPTAKEYSKR